MSIPVDGSYSTMSSSQGIGGPKASSRMWFACFRRRALISRRISRGARGRSAFKPFKSVVQVLYGIGLLVAFSLVFGNQGACAAAAAEIADAGNASMELGRKEFDKGRYAAAVKHFTAAIQEKGVNPESYLLRGRAYDRLGETAKAIQDFSRYVEARPSDPAGYIARGDARNFAGEHESALADYNEAVKLAPSSVEAHIGRGLARAGLEQYDLAIKDYQWVLVLQPDNHEVLTNLGVACMLARRPLEAVQYLERALKHESDPKWRQRINEWLETIVQNPRESHSRQRGPTKEPLW